MAKIRRIVIHCTATREGKDYRKEDVIRWHTYAQPTGNGWKHAGYHFLIRLGGEIEEVIPLKSVTELDETEIANGAKGFNDSSIHIAYIGGCEKNTCKPKDTRTPEQKQALIDLLEKLIKENPELEIVGHSDLDKTKPYCPGFDVKKEYYER